MNEIVLIALRRPYTFVVMSILIVALGSLTVLHMPTDVFPNITIPVTSVVWIYSGLLPQQVEGRITYLFERFLTSTVEGIKYIHSHSYYGSSITNIFLQDGVDVGRAEADIVDVYERVPERFADVLAAVAVVSATVVPVVAVVFLILLRRFRQAAALVLGGLFAVLAMTWLSDVLADRGVVAVDPNTERVIELTDPEFATSPLIAAIVAFVVIASPRVRRTSADATSRVR